MAAALITARNAKLVKISEHGQNWINALREDMALVATETSSIRTYAAIQGPYDDAPGLGLALWLLVRALNVAA